jgi:hypothetical protein
MNVSSLAVFGVSALMSLASSVVIAALYIWPQLRCLDRHRAVLPLVMPHLFLRFIGLSFLVPGALRTFSSRSTKASELS